VYSLRYTDFIAPMVKAIQEQQQTIEALQKINIELIKRLEVIEAINKSRMN
jgi:hypothetical protein